MSVDRTDLRELRRGAPAARAGRAAVRMLAWTGVRGRWRGGQRATPR